MRRRILVAGLAMALGASAQARAHTVGISTGEYRASSGRLEARLTVARGEALRQLPELDADRDGALEAEELAPLGPELQRAFPIRVMAGTSSCAPEREAATLVEEDGLELVRSYRCTEGAERFEVQLDFLARLPGGHRHFVHGEGGGSPIELVAHSGTPSFALAAEGGDSDPASVGLGFLRMGVEHILAGIDHLVFLFGVVLLGGSLRRLLWVITAFTLAHSLTLGAAALGAIRLSPAVVEPLIALSIAYVGIENLLLERSRHRWLLAFVFGLVHGFGFAGALLEVRLPQAELVLALLSFNVGVELGQLGVLLLFLPALRWLWGRPDSRRWIQVLSAAVALAGLSWLALRLGLL